MNQVSRRDSSVLEFASSGARTKAPGQGILGKSLAVACLDFQPHPPILGRIIPNLALSGTGYGALEELLQRHIIAAGAAPAAFSGGISAGKNTYTYDAHTYHTKVPPQGIAELVRHYLPKGGLVLDPFAGSGMTGVAARVLGADCILNELSPAACFIANRFTSSAVSPDEFEASLQAVLSETRDLRRRLYSTRCRECGKSVELLYTVWSYKVICNHCDHQFQLWDVCRKYGRTVREHKILTSFPCPQCGEELQKSRLARTTAEPVMVGYKCCGSKQQERTHPPNEQDLLLIQQLATDAPLAEGFFPTRALPDGVNLRQPKKHGLDTIDKFYTPRNLAALSHLWKAIHRVNDAEQSAQLAFVFTSLYQRVTRLSEFRFWGGSGNTAHFNVPFISDEANVFVAFERKARTIEDHLETTARSYGGECLVVNGSATKMDYLPENSVDLIFTDPPFGANINYSEMNLLWESWLGAYTDNRDEAIINRAQGKSVVEYEALMGSSLQECYRVLRPGHWMMLVFMNSSRQVWEALRRALSLAKFEIVRMDSFDKRHGTFKQFVSENTAGMDLVIHCRKPNGDGLANGWSSAESEDVITFLQRRHSPLPRTEYLHVDRRPEIDFRALYSEWLGQALIHSGQLLDFSRFREVVRAYLAGEASE